MRSSREFRVLAGEFIAKHLPFLDRQWLYNVLQDKLAELLAETVEQQTSTTSNTALREAAKHTVTLAEAALSRLPTGAKTCRCRELDDGEHRPQPLCHVCSISLIKVYAVNALDGKAPRS